MRRTLNRDTAEELTAQTFLKFAEQCRKRAEVDSVQSYLYGIARHELMAHLRRKYLFLPLFQDWDIPEPASEPESTPVQTHEDRLKELLPQLPLKQRQVIELRLLEKLSPDEIAERLGRDRNYIRTTQKRAVHNLRKLLARTPGSTIPIE
jgi:RNA polymerase sigma factor (sigma-70 family)